jgi:hypothetical protein
MDWVGLGWGRISAGIVCNVTDGMHPVHVPEVASLVDDAVHEAFELLINLAQYYKTFYGRNLQISRIYYNKLVCLSLASVSNLI